VDLSLDKLAVTPGKHLKQMVLSGSFKWSPEMLMDVNKRGELPDSFVRAQFTAT
jgi:hypothetical protein